MKVVLRTLLLLCTVIAIAICGYFALIRPHSARIEMVQSETVELRGYGVVDFIQYWSAYRVVQAGKDPYSPENMREVQSTIGPVSGVTMMWNPPWLLLIMKPILELDLHKAVVGWFLLNIFFLFVAVVLCGQLYPQCQNHQLVSVFALLFFPPFWNTLHLGQISLLYAFVFLAFAVCLQRQRDFLAGLCLSLLSIKPHLVYLIVLVLMWWALKQRRYMIILGTLIGLAVLICGSLEWQGPALFQWIDAQLHPESVRGVVRTDEWMTATIAGAIRAYSGFKAGPQKIEYFVTLSTVLLAACWLVHFQPKISWHKHLPLFAILSLITAPYGWFFDQSIAVVAIAYGFWALREHAEIYVACLFGYYMCVDIFVSFFSTFHHQMFFFPIGLLIIFFVNRNSSNVKDWERGPPGPLSE